MAAVNGLAGVECMQRRAEIGQIESGTGQATKACNLSQHPFFNGKERIDSAVINRGKG